MSFLDSIQFLFEVISKKYDKWGEAKLSGLYALCIISLLYTFNLISIWILSLILKLITQQAINGIYFYILFLFFLLVNYLLVYKRKNYSNIPKNSKRLKKIRTYAILYVLLTVIFFLTSFVYYLYFT